MLTDKGKHRSTLKSLINCIFPNRGQNSLSPASPQASPSLCSRWIRLLFGREFPLQDLLMVWDAIFSDINPSFPLVDYLTVAMLSFIREPCEYLSTSPSTPNVPLPVLYIILSLSFLFLSPCIPFSPPFLLFFHATLSFILTLFFSFFLYPFLFLFFHCSLLQF